MATVKAYTDIGQSKKLVEILPAESADMYYQYVLPKSDKIKHIPENGKPEEALEWYNKGYTHFGKEPLSLEEYCIPCWSLAALLELLPKRIEIVDNVYELSIYLYGIYYWNITNGNLCFESKDKDNFVDACYEAIVFLHEQKLL